ncbi:MAG: AAA family ATPase [Nanoarchaeota archaeon]|nr:AAA family ATPase [Nanoarchaeota archaeon]
MHLHTLKLHNIRSYTEQTINFPEGTTLLAGDVGAGKSTILLAIEFALFGILKGTTTGEALLRNGHSEGNVELTFSIEEKTVTIHRTLKRTTSINQSTGWISINGEKKDLSAVELKQGILDLLNYPKELLKKSKSLIYRYTVYTPQEEMKHILLGEHEERLDVLRRVFGIERYKRILENSTIAISHIKDKKKQLYVTLETFNKLQEQIKEKQEQLQILQHQEEQLLPQLTTIRTTINQQQTFLTTKEEHLKQLLQTQQRHTMLMTTIDNYKQHHVNQKKEYEQLQEQLLTLEKELQTQPFDTVLLPKKEQELQTLEQEKNILLQQSSSTQTTITHAQRMIQDIQTLDNCPTCKQLVNTEHKHAVTTKEQTTINNCQQTLQQLRDQEEQLTKKITTGKQELEHLRKQHQTYLLQEHKKHAINEKRQTQQKKEQQLTQLAQQLSNYQQELQTLATPGDLTTYQTGLTTAKKELEQLQQQERTLSITHATITTRKNDYAKELALLTEQQKRKERLQQRYTYLQQFQEYLENIFQPSITTMEKTIMLKVHQDFNTSFQQWFNSLMDNTIIEVTINEYFTPVIRQNGHDLDYAYLSGGEKTACALAYRLALNQTINKLMNTIKTKDLLILDEPTDGFSEEQLNKLRSVLEELNAKQILIVSHEAKIESFVKNLLRVTKQEHHSSVS